MTTRYPAQSVNIAKTSWGRFD
ncbi:hypothetical protein D049_3788A, partial [Vibrio parahaemolyticus VPTS-2010]